MNTEFTLVDHVDILLGVCDLIYHILKPTDSWDVYLSSVSDSEYASQIRHRCSRSAVFMMTDVINPVRKVVAIDSDANRLVTAIAFLEVNVIVCHNK